MNKLWVIARKDLRDLYQGKTYLYMLFILVICIPYFDVMHSILESLSAQGAGLAELRLGARSYLDSIAYSLPLAFSMFACTIIAGYSIAMDKAKRTLEPLLATPVSIRQVWLGKSLAVAIPGIVTGFVGTLLLLLALNLVVIVPVIGSAVVPGFFAFVSVLVISPLLVTLLIILVSLFQLITTNPRVPALVFSLVYIVLYLGTMFELVSGWNFSLIYIVLALLLAVVLLASGRNITRERVVLSSKG